MILGTLWLAVFAAMVVDQARRPGGVSAGQMVYGPFEGHRFGALTIRDVASGEVWRTLTATFVHYGLLHIGLNLWAFYQLGCLVESWYGSGPFVAVYVLTGGLGNLLSAIARRLLHQYAFVQIGGGSTVVMGLMALCAVVGWRSGTRMGDHLRTQMLWALVLTGALGIGLFEAGYPVIDNWGHGCGALVGAGIGLAHPALHRRAGRLSARLAGVVASLILAGSALALVVDDRTEKQVRLQVAEEARRRLDIDDRLIASLEKIRETYRTAIGRRVITRGSLALIRSPRPYPGPLVAPQNRPATQPAASGAPLRLDPEQEFTTTLLSATLKYLNALTPELDNGATSADFQGARHLLVRTLYEPPTLDEVRALDDHLAAIVNRLRLDRLAAEQRQTLTRFGG